MRVGDGEPRDDFESAGEVAAAPPFFLSSKLVLSELILFAGSWPKKRWCMRLRLSTSKLEYPSYFLSSSSSVESMRPCEFGDLAVAPGGVGEMFNLLLGGLLVMRGSIPPSRLSGDIMAFGDKPAELLFAPCGDLAAAGGEGCKAALFPLCEALWWFEASETDFFSSCECPDVSTVAPVSLIRFSVTCAPLTCAAAGV